MLATGLTEEPTSLEERRDGRLAQSFVEEEKAGRLLAIKGRTIALLVVAVLITLVAPYPEFLFYQALIAVFILLGLLRLRIEKSDPIAGGSPTC